MIDPGLEQRLRGAYEKYNDERVVDPDVFDPDVEWHNAPEFPGASVHHGIDAVMRDLERQQEAWGESRYEPTEILPAGDDRCVVVLAVRVKGAASGASATIEGAHLLTFRDDKVVRVQAFVHRDHALAAAGIERSA